MAVSSPVNASPQFERLIVVFWTSDHHRCPWRLYRCVNLLWPASQASLKETRNSTCMQAGSLTLAPVDHRWRAYKTHAQTQIQADTLYLEHQQFSHGKVPTVQEGHGRLEMWLTRITEYRMLSQLTRPSQSTCILYLHNPATVGADQQKAK